MFAMFGTFITTNFWAIFITAGTLILMSMYYFSVSNFDIWKKRNVPYIPPIPLFGNYMKVAFSVQHPVTLYRNIYQELSGHKYGGFFQMKTPYLMIRDPEIAHNILIKDFAYFVDRGIYADTTVNPLTANIFFMKGKKWKLMRSKLSSAFTSGKLKQMYKEIKSCSDQLMSNFRKSLKESNNEIEVRDELAKYATDVIGTCVFGLRLNAISDDKSDFRVYGKKIFEPSITFILNELVKLTAPLLLKVIKVREFPKDSMLFFQQIFLDTIKYRAENNIVRNDFVQSLIQTRNEMVLNKNLPESEKCTDKDIVGNAFVMFAAGFETVSTTLGYCLYELALKKEIQDKVRAEFTEKLSKNNGEINSEFLLEIPYLDMVLAETLRKYPPLFALFRECVKTYKMPNENLVIEKGQKIIIANHSIHHDTRYYTDPLIFNPERFSTEEKDKRPNGTYFPFGDGPRMCIGKRFAELEIKLALIEILSNYELEPCEKTEIPITYNTGAIVLTPKYGIWLKFKEIKK